MLRVLVLDLQPDKFVKELLQAPFRNVIEPRGCLELETSLADLQNRRHLQLNRLRELAPSAVTVVPAWAVVTMSVSKP